MGADDEVAEQPEHVDDQRMVGGQLRDAVLIALVDQGEQARRVHGARGRARRRTRRAAA